MASSRKATLKKKASELMSLCGAEVVMVFVGPDGKLETWPDDPIKAHSTVSKFYHAQSKHPNFSFSKFNSEKKRKKMKLLQSPNRDSPSSSNTQAHSINTEANSLSGLSSRINDFGQNNGVSVPMNAMAMNMGSGEEIQVPDDDDDGFLNKILMDMIDGECDDSSTGIDGLSGLDKNTNNMAQEIQDPKQDLQGKVVVDDDDDLWSQILMDMTDLGYASSSTLPLPPGNTSTSDYDWLKFVNAGDTSAGCIDDWLNNMMDITEDFQVPEQHHQETQPNAKRQRL